MNRIGFIGGSDIAAILNISPWKDSFTLWREKVGEISGQKDTPAMQHGRERESFILDHGEDFIKTSLFDFDEEGKQYYTMPRNVEVIHPEYPFLIAHLDGLFEIDGKKIVVEAKTAKEMYPDGVLPEYYKTQVAFYCALSGAEEAYVFTETDEEFHTHSYQKDVVYEDFLIKQAIKFWKLVETKTPPNLLTPSNNLMIDEYVLLKKEEAKIKKKLETIKNKIFEDHQLDGVFPTSEGWLKLKTNSRISFDIDSFKKSSQANKDAYDFFQKETVYRDLRLVK